MSRLYRSRIDWWLAAIVLTGAAVSLAAAVAVLIDGVSGGRWIAAFAVTVGVAFPLWTLASTSYELSDDQLLIRSGPFRWRVSLVAIRSIEPTRNPLSSPALSLDRLAVSYGNGRRVLISPRDREAFLAEIWKRIADCQPVSEA